MECDDTLQLVGLGVVDGPDKQHACIVNQYLHTPAIGPTLLDNMFCGSGLREVYTQDGSVNATYLRKILAKEAGDGSGLIYGMGHAVYTKSDPRAVILKAEAEKLVVQKGFEEDFKLLNSIERLSPALLNSKMIDDTGICANVDMYSGLVYRMLGIPRELFTPLFAVARMSGWCAHRLEEIQTCRRIMRPAYRPLFHKVDYVDLKDRG